MSKQSTITNLIVMPLIASAVFLASPALASGPDQIAGKEIMNGAHMVKHTGRGYRGIAGTVVSISDDIITVQGTDKINYTVDAGNAIIMKASAEPNTNPAVVHISDIKVGDTVLVRGTIGTDKAEITASKIFDGKMPGKHLKNKAHKLRLAKGAK